MADLMTMRMARAAERRADAGLTDFQVDFQESTTLLGQLKSSGDLRATARQYLDSNGYPSGVNHVDAFLAEDRFLASAKNRPTLDTLLAALVLPPSLGGQVATSAGPAKQKALDWLAAHRGRAGLLATATLASLFAKGVDPALRSSLARALSIYVLIDHVATNYDSYQPTSNGVDPSAEIIFNTLRWRKAVYPRELAAVAQRLGPPGNAVMRQGVADLYVLSSEWKKYEPGEIAYIENVLPGEKRKRQLTQIDERETSTTVETTVTSSTEQDNQATDRFELNDEATRDVQLAVHAEAQVDTTGQYGPTKVDTHLGGSLEYSQHDTTRRAVTQSRETVARSVTRVEQSIRTTRSQRSLTRTKELNVHQLQNAATQPFSGIYRWVDKTLEFTLKRYPNRYLLEFQIPEPAAWLRWLYKLRDRPVGISAENPAPFTVDGLPTGPRIAPDNIKESPLKADKSPEPCYYATLGARYFAAALEPAPAPRLSHDVFVRETENPWVDKQANFDPVKYAKLGDITVPAGYIAKRWWITLSGYGDAKKFNRQPSDKYFLRLYLGQRFETNSDAGYNTQPDWADVVDSGIDAFPHGPFAISADKMGEGVGHPTTATKIPVSVDIDSVRGLTARITVECVPSERTLQLWRIATYEKLASAFFAMKDRYDNEVAASAIRRGVVIQGNAPERNKQVVREELKKHIVGMLFDRDLPLASQPFTWERAVQVDDKSGEPSVDTALATERAATVLFVEQAFEWEKLSYVPYPYLWSDRATQWTELADLQSADPEFADFLRAGSVRTVLSVRPGFESAVQLFLQFGVTWNGGNPPAPGEVDYLSIADELRTLQRAPDDGEVVETWDARLPTSLVWLQGALALPGRGDDTSGNGSTGGDASDPKPWLCRVWEALTSSNR